MARKLRVQYPGAICHVMNRGDRREAIFKDDVDRRRFLAERLLAGELVRMGWTEADLMARRKGHPGKVKLALELRAKTAMPVGWIADRLKMVVAVM